MLAAANITSSDVDLAANYLAHRFGKGSAQVILVDGNAVIHLSLPMATIPINGYINLAASVMEVDGKPTPVSAGRETHAARCAYAGTRTSVHGLAAAKRRI